MNVKITVNWTRFIKIVTISVGCFIVSCLLEVYEEQGKIPTTEKIDLLIGFLGFVGLFGIGISATSLLGFYVNLPYWIGAVFFLGSILLAAYDFSQDFRYYNAVQTYIQATKLGGTTTELIWGGIGIGFLCAEQARVKRKIAEKRAMQQAMQRAGAE